MTTNTLTTMPAFTAAQLGEGFISAYASVAMAANTIAGYRAALSAYTRFNGAQAGLTYSGTRAMIDGLTAAGNAPETINGYIGSLSRIMTWAAAAGIVERNFLDSTLLPRLPTVEKLNVAGRAAEQVDLGGIYALIDQQKPFTAKRDAALLTVLAIAGLRKSEAAELKLKNVTENGCGYDLFIEKSKNGSEVMATVPRKYAHYLTNWIAYRQNIETETLFVSERGYRQLNTRSIGYIVGQYGVSAVHVLRHYCGWTMAERGADLLEISRHLHNSPSVCAKYYVGQHLDKQRQAAEAYL